MSAKLHFISGKGGTGKSTFAAALAISLARNPSNLPILTIDVQGSGHCGDLLGIQNLQYLPRPSIKINDVWGCKIMPQDSFQEYFTRALFPGSGSSLLGEATSGIRERIVSGVFSNAIVKSFIEVCPGLEPSAMLGKIHFECTEGCVPETQTQWKHVIVDAPSTGHFLALFSSIEALTRVFSAGIVLRQSVEIFKYMKDTRLTEIYLMTLPSELPAQETLELKADLKKRGLGAHQVIVNRMRPKFVNPEARLPKEDPWKNFLNVEAEIYSEEQEVVKNLKKNLGPEDHLMELPESLDPANSSVEKLADKIQKDLG
jgi:anion-transporting  ArsA/GET3 family ATPase